MAKDTSLDIAVYYFPGWHPNSRCSAIHGEGWTEWELVRRAEPRFRGHIQPVKSVLGEYDESDPEVMAHQIDLAADHGVSAFIFDWYWYDNQPFLEAALDKGFLQSPNRDRIRFALMWANHDWFDLHPAAFAGPHPQLFQGAVSSDQFDDLGDEIVTKYFNQPNYLTVDGRPYFSIYELGTFLKGLGGVEPARRALDELQKKARAAGLGGVHVNAVVWGFSVLPSEVHVDDVPRVIRDLGIDSITSYAWVHHFDTDGSTFPSAPYGDAFDQNRAAWEHYSRDFRVPYFPNVTAGWDSSPRTLQSDRFRRGEYPWLPVLVGSTPSAFEEALEAAVSHAEGLEGQRLVTLNAWNEWTEGSYLLPDQKSGTAKLEAIARVVSRLKSVSST